ncbi:glycosyltransferase family 8 protein [Lasallia pustulata]|uniref:Glycosyltransferase family 8 protein n=1 Tax=Lasallia pustulata TaxID=136370 RepID=A0A1W5D7Q9_9LECA|nr:glycosyltransferase family 8 protein [Lasallia pustulata]
MLILRNIDALMDLPLDPPSLLGTGARVFAATHACVCNPLRKPHYPRDWVRANCAYTTQHGAAAAAQVQGAPATAGLGMPNGGLQVVNPSAAVYERIVGRLAEAAATEGYEFADQSLLGDLFAGRWVALPYVYNGLKTMRWAGVHAEIWRDEEVRNVHFILSPKPWEEEEGGEGADETHKWWWRCDAERRRGERERGLVDGF